MNLKKLFSGVALVSLLVGASVAQATDIKNFPRVAGNFSEVGRASEIHCAVLALIARAGAYEAGREITLPEGASISRISRGSGAGIPELANTV